MRREYYHNCRHLRMPGTSQDLRGALGFVGSGCPGHAFYRLKQRLSGDRIVAAFAEPRRRHIEVFEDRGYARIGRAGHRPCAAGDCA